MSEIFEIVGCNNQTVKGNKWLIENSKKTIVIAHGMNEYSLRYDQFAKYLNEQGYDVFGLDHIGHGLNVDNTEDLLKWPKNGFDICVDNIALLISKLKEEGREVILFAHSMGSFMAQRLMQKHSGIVEKVILCGTGGPSTLLKFGAFFCKLVRTITINGYKKSKLLNKLCFASYNNKIKKPRTEFDWLSVNEENVAKYIKDPYCGNIPSRNFFASFVGSFPIIFKKKNLNKINPHTKVLFIAGKEDPVGGYIKTINKLQALYIKRKITSKLITYDHMRHEILNEDNYQIVYKDIVSFIE